MKILYVPEINGSAVVPFVAKAWLALMADGQWSKREVLVSGDLQCVFAVVKRRVVGCLTFHVQDGQAVINIAYVLPQCRGNGVYKALHEAFVKKARECGGAVAVNICYASNTAIQETCKRLGYTLSTQDWRLKL